MCVLGVCIRCHKVLRGLKGVFGGLVRPNLGLKLNQILCYRVIVRKIVRKSKERNNHVLNLPKEVLERLDLIGATVKITIKNDRFIVSKIVDESDDVSKKIKSDVEQPHEESNYTIH